MTLVWPLHLSATIRRFGQPLCLIVGLSSQCIGLTSTAWAQAIPDSTLGGESSHVRSVNPNTDQIDHGAQRGRNLFHSFESFNIGKNQTIQFSVPAGVQRIFSRVTGDDVSNILGTLRPRALVAILRLIYPTEFWPPSLNQIVIFRQMHLREKGEPSPLMLRA